MIEDFNDYLTCVNKLLGNGLVKHPGSLKHIMKIHRDENGDIIGWTIDEWQTVFSTDSTLHSKERARYDPADDVYCVQHFKHHFEPSEESGLERFRIDNCTRSIHVHCLPDLDVHTDLTEVGYTLSFFDYLSALRLCLAYHASGKYPFCRENAQTYCCIISK